MNSPERVIAALERKIPDRLPTFEWLIDSGVINALCPGADLFDFVEKMGIDAIAIRPDFKKEKINENTYREETGLIKKKMTEDYLIPVNQVIRNEKDLRKFEFPDLNAPYRFQTLKKAVDRFKGKIAIIIWLRDGFAEVRDLHGFEETLIDFIDNPSLVKAIINQAIDYYSEIGRLAAKMGAEAAVTGDDIAGKTGLLMSVAQFRDCIYPAMKRLYKNLHHAGLYVIKHTDGDIYPLMDLLIDTGMDCIDPIDPSAGMSLERIKREYGKRVCIKGNVDCAGSLVFGSEEEVEKEVKDCIRAASKGGGYIISSSNSIHSSVKPQNYVAMLKAISKYGKYDLAGGTCMVD
jgi:uroporphyrinogen decarboxylase